MVMYACYKLVLVVFLIKMRDTSCVISIHCDMYILNRVNFNILSCKIVYSSKLLTISWLASESYNASLRHINLFLVSKEVCSETFIIFGKGQEFLSEPNEFLKICKNI